MAVNHVAVRAVNRIVNRRYKSMGFAESMDCGFDGGEFSGSYHSRKFDEMFENVIKLVADRFNLPFAVLDEMVNG